MRVLLAEDDRTLATGITRGLTAANWTVDHVNSGDVAELAAQSVEYDALVLDINLPHRSGFDVLAELRRSGKELPVIVITARDSLEDRVHGLTIGADDYLTKPFDIAELNARLHAILRRKGKRSGERQSASGANAIELNPKSRTGVFSGVKVEFSSAEFSVIELLVSHLGDVVSKDEISRHLSHSFHDEPISANAVEVTIHRLRKKLEKSAVTLRTVRGLGYLLEATAPA